MEYIAPKYKIGDVVVIFGRSYDDGRVIESAPQENADIIIQGVIKEAFCHSEPDGSGGWVYLVKHEDENYFSEEFIFSKL